MIQSYRPLVLVALLALVAATPIANRFFFDSGAVAVVTVMPRLRILQPSILASGNIDYSREVELTSEIIGKVSEIFVRQGEMVREAQPVLRLDDESYAHQVSQFQAKASLNRVAVERGRSSVAFLEKRVDRARHLLERNLSDQDAFDEIEFELDAARFELKAALAKRSEVRAELEQANEQLSKTLLLAPITGLVAVVDIEVGETAIPSTPGIPGSKLMTIADPGQVIATAYVDEADIAEVQIGQEVELVVAAHPDRPLKGKIEFIANSARRAPGRKGLFFEARIQITRRSDVPFRPGMSCRVAIYVGSKDEVLSVPIEAVVVSEDIRSAEVDYNVFVVKDGHVKLTPVEVGISDDRYQAIVAGLEASDELVTGPASALRYLRHGDDVNPRASQ